MQRAIVCSSQANSISTPAPRAGHWKATGHPPGHGLAQGFSLNGPCQRGGYTSCRCLVVKNTLLFSQTIVGHWKATGQTTRKIHVENPIQKSGS